MILKGSVGVWIKFPKVNNIADIDKTDNQIVTSDDYILKEIKILNAGLSFGELALIENKPRAATIICKEDCGFAVLDKKNFDLILSKNQIFELNYIKNI